MKSLCGNKTPINKKENVSEYLGKIYNLLKNNKDKDGNIKPDDIWSLKSDLINELEEFKTIPKFKFDDDFKLNSFIDNGKHGCVFKCNVSNEECAMKIVDDHDYKKDILSFEK